ncbi:rhodanese-related sulfurtransferase/DNA-binding HxlR family transcriptional regulator [Lederbergia galactosidilyticus]|uniref:ArsR/SmtB family transcription factor n=1 Tax=Lederbergia galactosidilytica TaxID=217031 RepID=UPI001AE151C6|nr:metalloregulator ArsR/SmtB family transcription factor [Lederbergia galactosidilytica]MBP1917390.1 rhodanese-related sulfurtransferase/DNA-binding HxlR family transcriptional regulator [Lederbergia galactosidilytica]
MEELISSAKDYKDQLYKQLARVGKSLSSDKRLEILDLLSNGPKTVEKLARDSGMSVANVSRHLQILNDSRLVKFTKKGTYVIYSLTDESVVDFLYSLWKISENHISDINQIKRDFIKNLDGIETLSVDELYGKLAKEDIVLLDLRAEDEFENGHIEGAISVPMEELDLYLQKLPKDKEIIAYCRGKFCALSAIAAKKLKEHGFTAYSMDESFYAWEKYMKNH